MNKQEVAMAKVKLAFSQEQITRIVTASSSIKRNDYRSIELSTEEIIVRSVETRQESIRTKEVGGYE